MTPDFDELRASFPTLLERTYFSTHGFGPLLRQTLDDLDDYRRTLAPRNRVVEAWSAQIDETRELVARLVGALPDEIALGPNATACQASIAAALVPSAERDVILTTSLDFPSSRYLWHAQARRGFRIVEVPSRDGIAMPLDDLLAAIDERVAAVAIPLVAWNGAMLRSAPLIAAAHAAGAIVVLDASQAAGIVPIDVRAMGVDALVSGTNKWLSSGSTGLAFLYVRRSLAQRLAPAYPGWFAHVDPRAFAGEFEPALGARRFEQGSPAIEPLYAAHAGLRFALETGVDAMRARSFDLTDRLIAGIDALGINLTTPRSHDERGGLICLDLPDADRAALRFAEMAIDVDTRPGIGMRVSCHPCNSVDECNRLLAALAAFQHDLRAR
ncbi:MAG TPA: aminotransferase class V-fold PLP-dependent enzyme [Kofleriaceae bacterium]|jgi:selenocysteine lyase/cysteine desulfurase